MRPALLFLYRNVLRQVLELPEDIVRAKRPRHLPTVLTREEVFQVMQHLSGVYLLCARLLYGSGLTGSGSMLFLRSAALLIPAVVLFVVII